MKKSFNQIVKEYKISYKTLMELLHKSKSAIQTYMNGRSTPDIDSYIIIADYLNISLDEMLGRDSELVSIPKKKYDQLLETIKNLNELLK